MKSRMTYFAFFSFDTFLFVFYFVIKSCLFVCVFAHVLIYYDKSLKIRCQTYCDCSFLRLFSCYNETN